MVRRYIGPPMRWNRLVALPLALLCAGCGPGSGGTPSCAPLPTATPVSATAAAIHVTATPGTAAPGQLVQIDVAVSGPATLVTDCSQPLAVAVTDSAGISVDSGIAVGTLPSRCGALSLAPGEALAYQATWLPDATLPSGPYTLSVTVGDQPPLQLPLRVRTAAGGCG